jgi:hypothetical protein
MKLTCLHNMQADIESRLSLCAEACRMQGEQTNAIRIAVFIICFSMWMETWNSTFIPGRLAQQLLDILEASLLEPDGLAIFGVAPDPWRNCRDLQLWLLIVVTSIGELDGGFFEDLRPRAARLLRSFSEKYLVPQSLAARSSHFELSMVSNATLLRQAKEGFIYPRHCLTMCSRVRAWLNLTTTTNDEAAA